MHLKKNTGLPLAKNFEPMSGFESLRSAIGQPEEFAKASGHGNWTFFGSDTGGKTAAVLRSFIASCKCCGVEPFAWFRDVLSRLPAHSIRRLKALLPQNWQPATSAAQA